MKIKMRIFLVTLLVSFGIQGFAQTLTRKKGDNRNYGFVNELEEWIIQPIYGETVSWDYSSCFTEYTEYLEGVNLNGKWGFIDKTGKTVIPFNYQSCGNFSEGLARVQLDGKWGFIDKTGKMVIPPQFGGADSFSEGLAGVKLDGKWGFIDKTGKMVIPLQFGGADSFSEGLAGVKLDGKWGFIDKTGKMVIPPQFEYAEPFKNGLAEVKREVRGERLFRCGLIDKKGNIVVPMEYHGFFDHDVDGVPTTARIYGANDDVPTQYFWIQSNWDVIPVEGRPTYAGEGLYLLSGFYINRNGEKVIPAQYRHVGNFDEGKALVQTPDGKYVFINHQGSIVFAFDYDEMEGFESNGLARVRLDGKFGFADKQGNLVIPCIYDGVESFVNGYARVIRNNIRFRIDSTGKEINNLKYDPKSFSEGLAVATSIRYRSGSASYEECVGYIDRNENVVIPFDEDRRAGRNFSEGLAAVSVKWGSSGRKGFIDKTGKTILPCSYNEVTDFKDGVAYVSNDKKWGCINQSGNFSVPLNCPSKEAARIALDLTGRMEGQINGEIASARQMKDYKAAAKKLSGLVRQTEKNLDYKAALPESWEKSMAKIQNELGWIYYRACDYGNSIKTYGISQTLKQPDAEASVGELLAIYESGKKQQGVTRVMKGDFFLDHYVQALKNVSQDKKVNVEQKAACLSSFVIIAFDRAKRRRDYEAAAELLDKVTEVSGLADVAREHYFALCAKGTDFFTFKDAISKVYPQQDGVDFNIDYFNEEQLKTLFMQLGNTALSNDTLLKYKFELLDRLPVIHSSLCEEYEKAVFEKIKEGDMLQYRDYIRRFPNGSYTRQAINKLAQLEDSLYHAAVTEGRQRSYLRYLSSFPDGRYVAEARLQTVALSASQKAAIRAEQEKAMKEETDAIHKYIEIETQDIFFAKGDGLNFLEWIASTGEDMKNWNVFVVAKVKNKGKLPKRIKATVTLKITNEWSARTLIVSTKRKDIDRYTDDWYVDIEPGTSNIVIGYFRFQEKARAEGNIIGGYSSHIYIDEKNAFDIHFDYFDKNIPSSKLKAQTDLVEALRKNGNVQVKEGYASRYYEAKAQIAYREKEKAIERCMKCEIDGEKFTLPTEKEWLGMTVEKPGKIEMKNGDVEYYYWDKEGGLKVKDYIWDKQYKTWKDMESAFLEACRAEHCGDRDIREEADKRKKKNQKQDEQ